MFCSKCGKQIPDNTKFCNYCGAQQQIDGDTATVLSVTATQQENIATPAQQPKKAPKKKASIFVMLVVVLCAFLLGKFVIAPSLVSDSDEGGNIGNQSAQTQQSNNNGDSSTDKNNPDYDAIFTDTYIVHFQSFFMMESKSFALKQDDGIICCADYGYEDDVVKQWTETMYVPVSEYTDAQKTEVENTMKTQFATVDALNCCTVTYNMSANYFTITCTYSDVDQATSYNELYNAGVLQANTFISMSATETGLLSQGFVKK